MKAVLISGGAVLISVIYAFLFWFLQREASTPKIIKPKRKSKANASRQIQR